MVMPTSGLFDSSLVTYDASDDGPLDRNPNSETNLNATPAGPIPHLMSADGTGNWNGNAEGGSVTGGANGETFYWA